MAKPPAFRQEPLMTPGEVALAFRVDPKTVTRWANDGKLAVVRTLGGHRRYKEAQIRRLLGAGDKPDQLDVLDDLLS